MSDDADGPSWARKLATALGIVAAVCSMGWAGWTWITDHFQSADEARAMEARILRTAAWDRVQMLRQETIVSRNRVNDCAVKRENREPMSPLERQACATYDDEFRNATRRWEDAQRRASALSRGESATDRGDKMKLAWGARISAECRRLVVAIAQAVGIADPSELSACIQFESKWDPAARNPGSSATGLIQFMAATARGLGTTVEQLATMSAEDQLRYVHAYFLPFAGRLHSLSDVYMAILWPPGVGVAEDAIIFPAGSREYLANRGLDIDHDGAVSKREAAAFVARKYAEGMQPGNVYDDGADVAQPTQAGGGMDIGKVLQTGAGVLGMFNPLAGGVMGMAGKLLEAFQPIVQAKIAKELGRHMAPESAASAAEALAQTLVGQAQVLTGKADPFDAVAAVRAEPAKLATIEATTEQRMDALAKALEPTGGFDAAYWNAQREGRVSASSTAIAEKRAGIWDMTQTLVRDAALSSTGIGLCLVLAVVYQSMWSPKGIDPVLLALAGPLLMKIVDKISGILAYRFDGTKESSTQTKALIDAANKPKV